MPMRADKINDVDNISTPAIKNISINFLKKQSGKNFSLYIQRKKYNMHVRLFFFRSTQSLCQLTQNITLEFYRNSTFLVQKSKTLSWRMPHAKQKMQNFCRYNIVCLVFSISNFFNNKTSQANKFTVVYLHKSGFSTLNVCYT